MLSWAKEANRYKGAFESAFLGLDGSLYFSLKEKSGRPPEIEVVSNPSRLSVSREEVTVFALEGLAKASLLKKGALPGREAEFLELYLPYIFLSQYAQARGRAISVGHLAQTLDGRIATQSGHSQWIGNPSNLDHAHRMRALCDGILIGRGTLEFDRPQLTVRRMEGPNPVRVVVGSQINDLSCLRLASEEKILVFSENPEEKPLPGVKRFLLPGGEANCRFILEQLFREGVHSIWVEGGAATMSRFIREQRLDVIQLHIAPILLGSGKAGIQLDPIHRIPDALGFVYSSYFLMDGELLFCGEVDYKSPI